MSCRQILFGTTQWWCNYIVLYIHPYQCLNKSQKSFPPSTKSKHPIKPKIPHQVITNQKKMEEECDSISNINYIYLLRHVCGGAKFGSVVSFFFILARLLFSFFLRPIVNSNFRVFLDLITRDCLTVHALSTRLRISVVFLAAKAAREAPRARIRFLL